MSDFENAANVDGTMSPWLEGKRKAFADGYIDTCCYRRYEVNFLEGFDTCFDEVEKENAHHKRVAEETIEALKIFTKSAQLEINQLKAALKEAQAYESR